MLSKVIQQKKWNLFVLLLLSTVLTIIYSCKRSLKDEVIEDEAHLISMARQFYERETIAFEIKNRKFLSSDKSSNENYRTPYVGALWNEAKIEETSKGMKVVAVPLEEFELGTKQIAYARKMIFSLSGNNVIDGDIIEVYGKPSEIAANGDQNLLDAMSNDLERFTGAVVKYNLNYYYREGRYYENGRPKPGVAKLIKKSSLLKGELNLSANQSLGGTGAKISAIPGRTSAFEPEFEGENCENFYLVYIERDSYGNVVYWETIRFLYSICTNPNANDPYPGGGQQFDVYVDCNNEVWGTASRDACDQCVGGNTGLAPCAKKITVDPNARPCLDSISSSVINSSTIIGSIKKIFNAATNSAIVTDMIYRISQSSDWNVVIREGNLPPSIQPNGSIQTTAAETFPHPQNVSITFDSDYLAGATNLSVARTMIHELIHAYFVFGITYTLDPGYNDFVAANQLLFDKEGSALVDQSTPQHEHMANKYVDQISSLLYSYATSAGINSPDPNISLKDYCKDLAWGGLDKTKAYRLYAPNKYRIQQTITREATNATNSTRKKGC